MIQRCGEPGLCVPKEKWYDIKVTGDCIVFGEDLTCRDLTIEGDFVLIGNLFCNVIDIKGNCTIYGNIFSCEKIKVNGNLCVFSVAETTKCKSGGFLSTCANIEVGGNLLCDYRIRAGKAQIKVQGDLMTRDIECKSISVAGDCIVYPGTIDSDEAVYVLGDVTTGFAIETIELYCGGTYTRKLYSEKEIAKIYEKFKHWSSLN